MSRPLKTVFTCLLAVAFVAPALAARAKRVALPPKLDLPTVPLVFSTPSYPMPGIEVKLAALRSSGAIGGGSRWMHGPFMPCGFAAMPLPERTSTFGEPLPVLGTAYLKCRSVRVSELAPLVRVVDFPGTDFGDWVENGVMVRERTELSEDRMRELFLLLAECVDVPQEELFWYDEAPEIRSELGAQAEWIIDFAGEAPLRISYAASTGCLLVESGDDWGNYYLDAPRAAALAEFLGAKR